MKKLLLIMLCLITLTGCGNEVEQKPNEPTTKQEEKIEEKYLTVELEIEKEYIKAGEYWDAHYSNKVKSFKVENDEQGIFTNITLEDILNTYIESKQEFWEANGITKNNISKSDYLYSTIIEAFSIFASKHGLAILPDYSVYLDETKTSTSIIFKSKDEIKSYEDKINLNDNIVVYNQINNAAQFKDKCAEVYLNYYGKNAYISGGAGGDATTDKQLGMGTENTCAINPTQDRLDKLSNIQWVKYLDKVSNGKHEQIILSRLEPLDSVMHVNTFFKERVVDEIYTNLVKETHLFADGNSPKLSEYNQKEYFILDEKTCEEYNLVCDRW